MPALFQVAVLILCIAGAFFVYRNGIADVPRDDHINLLAERSLVVSDWDYFWHTLTYTHSSFKRPGDYFLIRPGFYIYLALTDFFFRHNLYVIGALSVLLHAFAVFVLFLIVSRLANRLVAVLFSIMLLTQYAGMEIVYWKHINPYLAGLVFFGLGLFQLAKRKCQETKCRPPVISMVVFFTFASLFHESFFYAIVISGIIFAFFLPKENPQSEEEPAIHKKELLIVFGLATTIYVICAVTELVLTHPPSFFGPGDHVGQLGLAAAVSNMAYLIGLVGFVFWLPVVVKLEFADYFLKAVWNFSVLPAWLMYSSGAFFLSVFTALFVYYVRRLKCGANARTLVMVVTMVYLGFSIFGLAVGRMVLRSPDYMKSATYYFYISTFMLFVLCAILYIPVRERLRCLPNTFRVSTYGMLAALFVWQIPWNYTQLDAVLKSRTLFNRLVANSVLEISKMTGSGSTYCYGGTANQTFSTFVPYYLVYRFKCASNGRTPLYINILPDGKAWFTTLTAQEQDLVSTKLQPKTLTQTDESMFGNLVEILHRIRGDSALELEFPVRLSKQSFDTVSFEAAFQHAKTAGLVIAYQNSGNFIIMGLHTGWFYFYVFQDGAIVPGSTFTYRDRNTNDFTLSVVRLVSGKLMIRLNQNILAVVPGIDNYEGQVGLYGTSDSRGKFAVQSAHVQESVSGTVAFSLKPVLILKTTPS